MNFTVLQTLARSFVFGLVHLVAGIPIGAALALTVSGLLFAATYRVALDRPRMPALVATPEITGVNTRRCRTPASVWRGSGSA